MITNKDLSIDSENGKIILNGDKYDLVTQGEIDTAVKDVYFVMGQMGAKNLIPYPYTNAYRTTNGVTITEGSITGSCVFNGTSTGRVDAQLGYRNSNALTLLPSVQYCLSIKTDGSFVGNLAVDAWNKGTTTYAKSIARVTPISTGSDYKEVKFSVTQSDINNYDIAVLIYGTSGNTFNNVTVYPMLRLASDTDNTYEQYAMTNKQLTDQLVALSGNFTSTQYTDFNDLPHGSIVQIPGSAAHAPGQTGHYYIVFTYFIGSTTTFKTQFAIENTDGNLYTRDCDNGTWGNWNKFAKATS